jgi:hypothetical protein
MSDPYSELAAALENDGIVCRFMRPSQFVVSSQVGNVWPDRGNSFWVTHVAGRWYLFTWSPVGYRVPDSADITALCRTCMGFGESAMYSAPIEIVQQFGLDELSEEETDAVFREMDGDV